MSNQTGKCSRCGTELVKATQELGSKCPNYFNCSRFDIVTDESIIEELEKENEALKAKVERLESVAYDTLTFLKIELKRNSVRNYKPENSTLIMGLYERLEGGEG